MSSLPPVSLEAAVEDVLEGPSPLERHDRELVAEAIIRRLLAEYGDRVVAIALYGSSATGLDGPYSDIELWAALDSGALGRATRGNLEWVWGAGKAEVNLYTAAALRRRAAVIEADWALTHGKFVYAIALFEREASFVEALRRAALALPPGAVRQMIADTLVCDLYELVGKARNAVSLRRGGEMARHLVHLAEGAANLSALAAGHAFRSGSTYLEEAAALTGPDGYRELIDLVRAGRMGDPAILLAAVERYWKGLGAWIRLLGIDLAPFRRMAP
jgi:kanamycin nucleotidyltransferase